MNDKFYLQGTEEEMEFMPIIPLSEEEDPNADQQAIPEELPILPLRNTVLFPGVVIPITVGRDKSIKAVNDAYKADKLIGVIAQKGQYRGRTTGKRPGRNWHRCKNCKADKNAGWRHHHHYTGPQTF